MRFGFLQKAGTHRDGCRVCGDASPLVSRVLGVCGACLRKGEGLALARKAHAESRGRFHLPEVPFQDPGGVQCPLCVNACRIPPGHKGYCGLKTNADGKLVHLAGTARKGVLEWYYDPLPTNCVAEWCCAGGTGAGYPRYAHVPDGPEVGYRNLAVFYGACSFDCLFCQNGHYRERARALRPLLSAYALAERVDERTSCICFFGGDPTPQMPHALKTATLALEKAGGRILRICFESDGAMSPTLLKKAARLSLESGGCIKFDLKAWNENLHVALTGVTHRQTLENFRWLAAYGRQRREPPFLVASTLLVPGYVDAGEVEAIARFIASLDPRIPYALLAFSPHDLMTDLPTTSRKQAEECLAAARRHLENVRLGNVHLLS